MKEKIEALLDQIVAIPAMTASQYIQQIDSLILKAEHNFEIYNELLLIAEDYLADCQYEYDKKYSDKLRENRANGEALTILDKISKAQVIESDEMKSLLYAEKLQREYKVKKENACERYNALKKIKGGL
jgi:hypothetical protein